MSQLTGVFRGTFEGDSVIGSVTETDFILIDEQPTGIAALDLNLNSLGGDDVIEATVDTNTLFPDSSIATGIGISDSVLKTGVGNDTVSVGSTLIGFGSNSSPIKIDRISIGLQTTYLATGAGDDVVNILANSRASNQNGTFSAVSVGVQQSSIVTGADNDRVTIEAIAQTGSAFGVGRGERADGIKESNVRLGSGNDSLSVKADGAQSAGVTDSQIAGNKGDDAISVEVIASAGGRSGGSGTGVGVTTNSRISGGSGTDNIVITTKATGGGGGPSGPNAVGIGGSAIAEGGSGNDTIEILADASAGAVSVAAFAVGADNAYVFGDGGDDRINIVGISSRLTGASVSTNTNGVMGTLVDGGNGNDTIAIQASAIFTSRANNGVVYGASSSEVNGGNGDDLISITSEVTLREGTPLPDVRVTSIGAVKTLVNGGRGNDQFSIRGVNLDIQDAILSGGTGADSFDAGIGSGSIYGDGGNDSIKLDFFDGATMAIELLGNDAIQIVGTQDKLGNANDWTQVIADVEQYEVAGTVYSAIEVVALLG